MHKIRRMALRSLRRFQSPFKHTVWLRGHRTSITVEPEFWDRLRLITFEYQTSMTALITEIDRTMRLMPFQGPGRHRVRTLSAAVRVFVLHRKSWPGLIIRLNTPPAALLQHAVDGRAPIPAPPWARRIAVNIAKLPDLLSKST